MGAEPALQKAVDGHSDAWRALRSEIEASLKTLAEEPGLLARIAQRESDRDNIVFEVISELEADDARRLRLYVDYRERSNLDFGTWFRVVAYRAAIGYVRRSTRDSDPVATPSQVSTRIATELLRHASGRLREPQLSALELWVQGVSDEGIRKELELDTDARGVVERALSELQTTLVETATSCAVTATLDALPPAALGEHFATCVRCRLVGDLIHERRRIVQAHDLASKCAEVEILIAARTSNDAVRSHLLACNDCQTMVAALGDREQQPLLPPTSATSYELGPEVARGGMGRVLGARDLRAGRPVAVKEMLGKDPVIAARFEREARLTAGLQHPNIVPIYEIGRWPDGTPFYAMRMVEGRTLREALRERGSLRERLSLLPALIAAADAIAFAHAKRVVHRDITPNNILLGAFGETVVIDWGLAKDLAEPSDIRRASTSSPPTSPELTSAGAVLGTAAYMSPEQARGDSVDERTDVYALGAILSHLLSGTPPPSPTPIARLAPKAPADLITIVNKAMRPEPADRYPSARELAEDLRSFQTGQLVESHHYTVWQLFRRFVRRHRTAVALSAVLVTALVLVLVFSVQRIVRARDAAEREQTRAETQRSVAEHEATRARNAEAEVQMQLDKLKAEQTAREKAELDARMKGTEAAMTREQLADALTKARKEREVAEQESRRARESERRAADAAAAERRTREEAERLYEQEKARVRAFEEARARGITTQLKKK